jgi:hypothetical protein
VPLRFLGDPDAVVGGLIVIVTAGRCRDQLSMLFNRCFSAARVSKWCSTPWVRWVRVPNTHIEFPSEGCVATHHPTLARALHIGIPSSTPEAMRRKSRGRNREELGVGKTKRQTQRFGWKPRYLKHLANCSLPPLSVRDPSRLPTLGRVEATGTLRFDPPVAF